MLLNLRSFALRTHAMLIGGLMVAIWALLWLAFRH
jgi:hypothetical protein